MPLELWLKVFTDHLDEKDRASFARVCRLFRYAILSDDRYFPPPHPLPQEFSGMGACYRLFIGMHQPVALFSREKLKKIPQGSFRSIMALFPDGRTVTGRGSKTATISNPKKIVFRADAPFFLMREWGSQGYVSANEQLIIWWNPEGSLLNTIDLSVKITALTVVRGHESIVVGTVSGELWLCSQDQEDLKPLTSHQTKVRSIAATQTHIVSGSEGGRVLVQDHTGTTIHQFLHQSSILQVGLSFDSAYVAALIEGGEIHVWESNTGRHLYTKIFHYEIATFAFMGKWIVTPNNPGELSFRVCDTDAPFCVLGNHFNLRSMLVGLAVSETRIAAFWLDGSIHTYSMERSISPPQEEPPLPTFLCFSKK